ncbi:MAG: hypothetical protein IKP04_07375 [Candidatus Methanomethylophilaceae archaeon]|nr:hypothetical protein [Candidatus Methanomethylophilaceae archaeon]
MIIEVASIIISSIGAIVAVFKAKEAKQTSELLKEYVELEKQQMIQRNTPTLKFRFYHDQDYVYFEIINTGEVELNNIEISPVQHIEKYHGEMQHLFNAVFNLGIGERKRVKIRNMYWDSLSNILSDTLPETIELRVLSETNGQINSPIIYKIERDQLDLFESYF